MPDVWLLSGPGTAYVVEHGHRHGMDYMSRDSLAIVCEWRSIIFVGTRQICMLHRRDDCACCAAVRADKDSRSV